MKHKVDGQILVIILLFISILSIVLLAMISNVRLDTKSTIENKQYEQYYSFGEQKLVFAQNLLGTHELDVAYINNLFQSHTNIFPGTNPCELSGTEIKCSLAPENYSETNPAEVNTTLYFSDDSILSLSQLASDSELNVSLDKNGTIYTDTINIYWKQLPGSTVDWVISLDYFNQSTDLNIPSFNTAKISTLDKNMPKAGVIIDAAGLPITIDDFVYNYGITFNIANILPVGIPSNTILTLRIKPLITGPTPNVSFSLVPATPANFPTQYRRITSVVKSNDISLEDTSPTVVLNLEYSLVTPISPLLDYVYRGKFWQQN